MLKLIATRTSPYTRKVRVALAEKKLDCELVEMSPWGTDNPVQAFSPLGKVPVLILDDGTPLYDSRVIVEYLDTVSPVSRLIPEGSRPRIAVRRVEALSDGICDAALSIVLERRRPAGERSEDWVRRQREKVTAGVAALAAELGERTWFHDDTYSLADIAAGCTLAYLGFRADAIGVSSDHANLARLSARLDKRATFAATAPA